MIKLNLVWNTVRKLKLESLLFFTYYSSVNLKTRVSLKCFVSYCRSNCFNVPISSHINNFFIFSNLRSEAIFFSRSYIEFLYQREYQSYIILCDHLMIFIGTYIVSFRIMLVLSFRAFWMTTLFFRQIPYSLKFRHC